MRCQNWLAVVALLLFGGVCALGQGQPTTLQSADALRAQGLTKVGALYLLEADAKLEEDLRDLSKTQTLMAINRRKRTQAERDIKAARSSIKQWTREYDAINKDMTGTKNTRKYNEQVAEGNRRLTAIEEAKQFIRDREKELEKMGDPRSDYITLVINLSNKMEEAAKKYEELAKDQRVQEAIDRLNEGATRKVKLGPSPRFTTELVHWRKERAMIASEVIKIGIHGGVPEVEVTLNGTLTQTMILDSGAAIVTLTAEVAHELGVSPRVDDPSAKLSLADGKEVEAKIILLDSIRLGTFTVENVECAVLPPTVKDADCLLGGTFLHHLVYQVNLTARTLQVSQLRDPADEKRTTATSRPSTTPTVSKAELPPIPATAITTYAWDTDGKNNRPVRMGGEDRVGFLSSIGGLFDSPDAYVGLHLRPTGDRLLDGGHSKLGLSVGGISLNVGDKPIRWKVTQYTWKQGDPPVKMIGAQAGFCCLSAVGGRFEGGGELVEVYIGDDGFWYLGGKSSQVGVCASALAYEASPALQYRTRQYTWRQESHAVRMIPKEEGFCYLASMTGRFGGPGEQIRVYVGDDGWWYVDGESHQHGVAATAIAVRVTAP